MTEISLLITALKRQLKLQGKTYGDVAKVLGVSEASMKRLLSTGRFSLERLVELSNHLGFTLAELAQEANQASARLRTLTAAQEKELVADERLLLVAVCAFNQWTFGDIVATYRVSEHQCVQYLARLDRLGLIVLLPQNRFRLNIARDFDWLPQGPIRHFFKQQGLPDFLDCDFNHVSEDFYFSSAMLTEAAFEKMQSELRQLRLKLADYHAESLASPRTKRRGTGLLLAMREWEPAAFSHLRRA